MSLAFVSAGDGPTSPCWVQVRASRSALVQIQSMVPFVQFNKCLKCQNITGGTKNKSLNAKNYVLQRFLARLFSIIKSEPNPGKIHEISYHLYDKNISNRPDYYLNSRNIQNLFSLQLGLWETGSIEFNINTHLGTWACHRIEPRIELLSKPVRLASLKSQNSSAWCVVGQEVD